MASPRRNGLHAVNVILCASATLCLVLAAQPSVVRADPLGAGSGTIYRLGPESLYQNGCFPPCLCPILLVDDVRGTFKLTFTGTDAATNIHSYAVDDVNWMVPIQDPNLRVVGSGSYQIGSPDLITVVQHRMQLDLRVGDGVVEHFDSGWLPVEQLAGIRISMSMNGMVCFDTVLEIAAEPVPPNQIKNYSLVEGSTYQRGCFDPCDCPLEAQRQMVGTFDLVPLSDNGTWAEFAVVNVDLMTLASALNDVVPIAGFGVYQRFAEFAVQHRLALDLVVGDENRTHFDSGLVVTNVSFPRIDIVVTVNEMVCFDTVLHVVADPSGGAVCGGFGPHPPCDPGTFCKFPLGVCDVPVVPGECTPIPNACPENFDPVCGCNGVTYDNECFSDAAGVSVNHPGVCEVGACCMPDGTCVELPFEVCFAEGGDPHPTGAPCDPSLCPGPLTGACCLDDFAGNLTCVETTEEVCIAERGQFLGPGTVCPPDSTSVCGPTGACCLGDSPGAVLCFVGTLDECLAEGGAFQGPGSTCPTDPNEPCGQVCGGFAGFECDDPATFCKFPIGTCQFDDIFGVCAPIPNACPEIFDPVCGCDGVTYSNECEADAAMVTVAHEGECEVACQPAPDGFGCTTESCSAILVFCLSSLLHLDIATGAITTLECDCFGFIDCHIEFGNASPFAVGVCPNEGTCQVFAADTDGDGIDDQFSAQCVPNPIRACCLDIDDGPVAFDTCVSTDQDTCQTEGGIFQAVNSTCEDTQACCFASVGIEFCNDMNPFCCAISGGIAQGVGSTCADLPSPGGCGQPCGGFGGIPCDDPDQFCLLPPGGCCCDFMGVCTTPPEACPAVFDPVCGCDGVTYGNACEAAMASVSIDHVGSCDGNCPDVWDPVCGVDGVTYSNACFAELAGVPIAHLGECGAMCGGFGPHPPCDPGTFCKYSPGVCGNPGVPGGECTPIPNICPDVWEPVCGCDGNSYGNECEADAAAVSIDHPGECSGVDCAATRVLSDPDPSYCSGVPKTVHILLTPPVGVTAVALDDTPPAGWIVSHISHGGTFDAINGKVKWGPFFAPDVPPEVTYDVTSAAGDIGVVCFVGMISLDGVNRPVCGDDCIAGEACCPFMDADLSQPQCAACPAADCAAMPGSCADGRISLSELAGYACAWMTGCNDDLSGMTRAAFVWRNGECYCWDDADLNWHPTTCPAADSGCCTPSGRGSDSTAGSATAVVAWDNLKKGVRSSGDGGFNWTRELQIAITVEPPPGTSATAVAMGIPRGWTVVTTSDGGQWDEIHRKVKWGPTFGDLAQSMTLRVRWLPDDAVRVARRSARGGLAGGFEGVVSFDGMNQPISMP